MATLNITLFNDTGSSNGGAGADHYHTVAVSDIQAAIQQNLPATADIQSVKLKVTSHIYRSSGNPKVYLKCWFCPNKKSDYNSGTLLLDWGTQVAMSSSSKTVDVSAHFTKKSPFNINTSYPLLSAYYEVAYVFAIDFYCKGELIIEYYEMLNYSATASPAAGGSAYNHGGTGPKGSSQVVSAEANTGYKFIGWYRNNALVSTDNPYYFTLSENNMAFVAKFEKLSYTVTFKNWDGTTLKTQTVEHGSPATAPSNPTRPYDSSYHYTFKGWDKSYSSITGTTTITATYTAVAHSYTTETSRTPSTCCKKGSVTKKCSCGATQTTELALDPNNHTGGTEVRNAVAATCTATGYTGDTYCKGCGAKTKSGTTIAKLSHSETSISAVAPTCTATGLTEGKKCSVCGTVTVDQQTVKALGHSYTEVITQPTASSSGYTTHICSRCGHSYIDSYTYMLTVNCDTTMGNVTGAGIYNQNGTATLTATPNTGYKFVRWSDGNTNASRTITVTESATYTAYFEKNPPKFTSAEMRYIDEPISLTNKVICNEGFIISVGVI